MKKIVVAIFAGLALTSSPALARDTGHAHNGYAHGHATTHLRHAPSPHPGLGHGSSQSWYTSSEGGHVHGPTTETNPAYGRVSAYCRDGTHSYSHHHRGTCSRHGGVGRWQ